MLDKEHQKLAHKAYRYKYAWLLCAAWVGLHDKLSEDDFKIHKYHRYSKSDLKAFIKDIEDDYTYLIPHILASPTKQRVKESAQWFADKFIEWQKSKEAIYCLGNYQEVDEAIGPLRFPEQIETPPYAEIILQGYQGCCCRHPEYMLARDLALTYNLFRDCNELASSAKIAQDEEKMGYVGENQIALGRLACIAAYNLMEGFLSGLVLEAKMTNAIDEKSQNKLQKMLEREPLKKRFYEVPKALTGETVSSVISKDTIDSYLGNLKQRRDAFVHCIPGTEQSKQGYVRQDYFNDIQKPIVTQTIETTVVLIEALWKLIYKKKGPRWLPKRDESGRFSDKNLKLTF